jgi:ribosomal-protein-alanine acetyltransferase
MDNAVTVIRRATAADVPQLLAIEQSAGEASHWSSDDYLNYSCHVAEHENRIIGFVLSRQVADGEFEVLNTAIAPEFRRRGVAFALLRSQLEQAQGRWFLEVRPSNSAARNLYKRLGFQEIGRRPGYYENPAEHAIVMSFRS